MSEVTRTVVGSVPLPRRLFRVFVSLRVCTRAWLGD